MKNQKFVVYLKQNSQQQWELWRVNLDGSEKVKINLFLPAGYHIHGDTVILSPDGSTILIKLSYNGSQYLYSADINGTNLKKLDSANALSLGGFS